MANIDNLSAYFDEPATNKKRLYYFTKPDIAKIIIESNKMKLSDFDKCNDIFELSHFSTRNRMVRDNYKIWKASIQPNFGFICFSSDWSNPLMWGHYADCGRGVCLVFDLAIEKAQQVRYITSDKMPKPPEVFPKFGDISFSQFCSIKSGHWGYECEWRLLVPHSEAELSNNFRLINIEGDIELLGAINGPRATLYRSDLESLLGERTYVQSRAAFGDYRVTVQRNKKLWV